MDMKKLLESIIRINESGTKKQVMDTLSGLRQASKEVETGTPFNGSLVSSYINDIQWVYSWLENNANMQDTKLQSILKGVMDLRAEAKTIEQSGLRMDAKNEKIANSIVNTLYPLQQWIETNLTDIQQEGAEDIDTEELANEVYAEFERIYPNLARRADERTVHAAIMDVLIYGGDSDPSALAQDVARAVKQEMQQGVNEGSEMDRSPGSPYDRGNADGDYGRSPRPHKMVPNEQGGRDMQKLTDPEEIEEYYAGYEAGDNSKPDPLANFDDEEEPVKPMKKWDNTWSEGTEEGQQLDEIGDDPKSKFSKLLPKVAKRGLNRSLKAFRQGDDENLFKYSDVLNRADARMSSGGSNYLPKKSTKSSDSGDGKYDEAQLYHNEFEDHMHANHGARLEGDDETALEHLEAAEEAAENYFNTTGKKIVSSDYDGDSPYITNSDLSEDLDEGTLQEVRSADEIGRDIRSSSGAAQNKLMAEMLAAIEYHYMQIQNAGDTGLDMLGKHAPTFSYFEKKYNHDIPTMFKKAKYQAKKLMLDELEKISDQLDFDMERNDEWLEEDPLRNRVGINSPNKKPRAGQTDLGNIPVGNLPNSNRPYDDEDRNNQSDRLKGAIKGSLGTHKKSNLPESDLNEVRSADEIGRDIRSSSGAAQNKLMAEMLAAIEYHYMQIQNAGDTGLDMLGQHAPTFSYFEKKYDHDIPTMFKKAKYQAKKQMLDELEKISDQLDFDMERDNEWLEEGIVGAMKKFRNALKIPTGADRFPGAEIPARAINAIQRNRTASALKNMNRVGRDPDSTASDFGRAVTDYGQRRDNMTGRGEAEMGEAMRVTAPGFPEGIPKSQPGLRKAAAQQVGRERKKGRNFVGAWKGGPNMGGPEGGPYQLNREVNESLTVTATDNDAYSLMRMVSLAGVPGAEKVEPLEPYSPYSKPVTGVIYNGGSTGCSAVNCSDSNCPTHGHDMMPMEEYANEPDESTCEVSSVTDNAGLGGLNGPKKQYPFAANRSENPLATNEYDIAERATKLAGMYNKFKGK